MTTAVGDFAVTFSEYLEDWNYVAAGVALNDPKNRAWVDANAAFELVPMVATYLNPDQEEKGPHMVQGCSQLLKQIAGFGSPKENLIALIEHCEAFEHSVKYRNVLPALGATMKRLNDDPKTRRKLKATWDWTLDTLTSHIRALVLPDIPECLSTTEERLLLDSDPDMALVVDTVKDFASMLGSMAVQVEEDRKGMETLLVRASMVVLGRPLVLMNLEIHNSKRSGQSRSTARRVAETLVGNVTRMEANVVSLTYLEECKARFKLESDDDWLLSTGVLFSVLFDDCNIVDPNIRRDFVLSVPSCYNPAFVLHSLMPSINAMMDPSAANQLSLLKAVGLSRDVMSRIPNGTLTSRVLEMTCHLDFLKHLLRVVVYNPVENVRKDAFGALDRYFYLYRLVGGRYRLISMLLEVANHSGILGYVISRAKDSALESMRREDYGSESEFAGHQLKVLVKRFAKLSNGAETDLLEVSDELMAGINFLICIFLKDGAGKNSSGVWDLKKELKDNFLAQLETGLNMSRAHYKEKLMSHDEGSKGGSCGVETSITVGGQELPTMTDDQRKSVILAALNTFDMIECVLSQLKDIIDP